VFVFVAFSLISIFMCACLVFSLFTHTWKWIMKAVYSCQSSLTVNYNASQYQNRVNSVASVRKRTIPTERPPLVREVSANFLLIEGATWSAWRIPTAVGPKPLLFLPSSSSVVLTRLSGPRSGPTFPFLVVPGNQTRDLRICSQELWPQDHKEFRAFDFSHKFFVYLTSPLHAHSTHYPNTLSSCTYQKLRLRRET
jgi:hypothetical protein